MTLTSLHCLSAFSRLITPVVMHNGLMADPTSPLPFGVFPADHPPREGRPHERDQPSPLPFGVFPADHFAGVETLPNNAPGLHCLSAFSRLITQC